MKAIVKEHIEQLDVSRGGGIVSDKIRVDTIDNPMLVIGLGGTGIDALLRLKYQINRRFKLPEDPVSKKKRDKPDNVEFLAFETNEHDRHKTYRGIGLDPLTEYVLLSNPEVGSLLQNRSLLEPYIREWLSPELLITDGINGASGIRQAGRLLLFTKIVQVVQAIEKKIKALSVGTNKKLIVFLLTGLSGGTGSGCFLDIAYITRGLIEREYGDAGVDKVNMFGYLFMPDVNLSNKSLSDHTREYIKKNGYAALKELDYWMNVNERSERFQQQYGNVLTVRSPVAPFNFAHLISATNLEGTLLENGYDYCMNVTAEKITTFMASEEKQSGEEFAIQDYMSNIHTNIAQMPKQYAANYQYNVIGASSAVLPIEEMTTFLAYRLFRKMEKMFEASPTREDIEKLARKLEIDPDSVHREFNKRIPDPLPGYQNSERLSYHNVIKQQIVSIDTELEQTYLSRAREEYIKTKKQLPGQVLEKFTDQAERMFLNPEQGPFYASRVIDAGKGYCLLNQISGYIESLKENVYRIPQDAEQAKNVAGDRLGDARSAFISREKKKDAYIEAKIQEYMLYADRERMEQMIEYYEDVHRLLTERNARIYAVFAEVLDALARIFDRNGEILTRGDEQVDHKGNKTYFWNVVSVPDIERLIGSIMDDRSSDELIRQFTAELLRKTNQWTREQEMDIVGSISAFLSDHFGDLITKSMEEFIAIKYGQDESVERVIERIIAKKLDSEAVPVFHLSNSAGSLHFPECGFVSVPADAPNIYKGVSGFKELSLGKTKFTIKESKVKNRIFWLSTKNGVPLHAYSPLKVMEESYEKTILEQEGVGRHLVQTDRLNWTNLPSPIPEKSWGDVYVNQRVRGYNAEVRSLFDRAVAFGCIAVKDGDNGTSSRYECRLGKPFDLNAFLSQYALKSDGDKPNFGELKRCISALRGLLRDGLEREQTRDIFNSINEERAKDNLIRSPLLTQRLRTEVAAYEQILAKAEELERLLDAHQSEEKLLDRFIEALYTKTIVKRGAQYVYDHDADEEAWEPFVNLIKVNKFYEYVLFERVRALDPKRQALLARKAERRSERMTASEDISELVDTLRRMAESYGEAKAQLDYDRDEHPNGEDMYRFYKLVAGKVNDVLKTVS